MRLILGSLFLLFAFSCRDKELSFNNDNIIRQDSSYFLLEDSLYAKTFFDPESHLGSLSIYKFESSILTLVQTLDSLEGLFDLEIIDYKDYNKDNKSDILLYYGSGARGGNTLNYLFVRDSNSFKFRYINGSSEVPNLSYNSDRDIIESMRLTGTTTFEDYVIEHDSLREITSVNVAVSEPYTIRKYSEVKNGKYVVIRTDSIKDEGESAFLREP